MDLVAHSAQHKLEQTTMSKIHFITECLERCIPFCVALENDAVLAAFNARDIALFCALLDSEF
ncbi:MAG: hypothetical protein EBS53_10210 [Bacteroidetes bacterium]|nr:hypothetical protein [Bacteroidota bacterium]